MNLKLEKEEPGDKRDWVLDDTVELLNQINLEILLAAKHFSYGS